MYIRVCYLFASYQYCYRIDTQVSYRNRRRIWLKYMAIKVVVVGDYSYILCFHIFQAMLILNFYTYMVLISFVNIVDDGNKWPF